MDVIVNIDKYSTNKNIFIKSHINIDYYLIM